jgi:hypothetical protein
MVLMTIYWANAHKWIKDKEQLAGASFTREASCGPKISYEEMKVISVPEN